MLTGIDVNTYLPILRCRLGDVHRRLYWLLIDQWARMLQRAVCDHDYTVVPLYKYPDLEHPVAHESRCRYCGKDYER